MPANNTIAPRKRPSPVARVIFAFCVAAAGTSPYWYTVAKNGGFTDVEGAKKTLRANNFTPVRVGGYGWSGCGSKTDILITRFEAVNIRNEKVTGVVCKNVFGTSSYRLN